MKKKIAIFGVKYYPSIGGTSRVVEQLIRALKDEYEFTIYCYRHEAAENYLPGVKTVQFPSIPIKGLGVFLYYLRCCWHIMTRGDYDLVHAHKTDSAFFLPILTRKYPCITTSHALPYLNDKWSAIGKTYFHLVEKIYMNTKAEKTSISRVQAAYYEEKHGKPVRFIPNGIEPVTDIPTEKAQQVLDKHGISGRFIFFAARRIIPLKGAHTMLKALQAIQYDGHIVMAGDTKQLPSYTQQLKKLGKGLNLHFIGFADKETLFGLVKLSRFFIFPSEIEGMSMMLLEVGAVGTPMICSDIPPNQAVFGEEEVLFFKSQQAADLQEKVVWARNHYEAMEEKAQRAREKVFREYAMDAVAAQYSDLYRSLLGAAPLPDVRLQEVH